VFPTRIHERLWPVLAFVLGDYVGVTATDLAQIPMSADLGSTLARGSEFAEATGAGEVTLEHLLGALCDDPDAIAVLDASQINIERLRADVTARAYQGGVQSQAPSRGGLAISEDVRRILEAAAAAARGSRRREINGAIVLAAIVGDARSTAAEILQAHGLNFDGAIRALQSALAPVRDMPAQVPVADDVLARARERVQSRSTPSLRDMMKDMPRSVPPQPVVAPETVEKEHKAPAASAVTTPPSPAPAATPAQPDAQQAAVAPAEEARGASLVGVPQTTTGGKGPMTPAPAPAPAPFHPPRGPGAVAAAVDPALPFPSHPAAQRPGGGTHPVPEHKPAWQPGQLGSGRDIPDFIRERKGTASPPPIPPPAPMPSMHPQGAPQGARARAPVPPPGHTNPQSNPSISRPLQNAPAPQQRPQRGAGERRGKPVKVEAGKIAENIPRTMRVGKTARVEIRIAKASVAAFTEGLEGGGPVWQHKVTVTKAMAVRLRAPEGGFFIETASPETQWIENNIGFPSDDFASWRFLVTPQSRGWSQLQIIVSARTVGADGVAAETALPDQIVEVKVRRNIKRTVLRLLGWTVAAVVGGALSTFGQTGLAVLKIVVQKFFH
jgi:neural Wiskott-Aldrich syndrome protein